MGLTTHGLKIQCFQWLLFELVKLFTGKYISTLWTCIFMLIRVLQLSVVAKKKEELISSYYYVQEIPVALSATLWADQSSNKQIRSDTTRYMQFTTAVKDSGTHFSFPDRILTLAAQREALFTD